MRNKDLVLTLHPHHMHYRPVQPLKPLSKSVISHRRKRMTLPAVSDYVKPKVVLFYKNGDRNFRGSHVTVTSRRFRNFDNLLSELTRITKLSQGARYIFTPDTGTRIASLDELLDGKAYVCGSFPKLKKINYNHAPDGSKLPEKKKLNKNFIPAHAAPKLENEKQPANPNPTIVKANVKPKIIHIIRNGISINRKVTKVLLNKRTAQTYEQVLNDITSTVGVVSSGFVRKLYNKHGKLVVNLSELFGEEDIFIAVGSEKFKSADIPSIIEEAGLGKATTKSNPSLRTAPSISPVPSPPKTLPLKKKKVNARAIPLSQHKKLPSIGKRSEPEGEDSNKNFSETSDENFNHVILNGNDSHQKPSPDMQIPEEESPIESLKPEKESDSSYEDILRKFLDNDVPEKERKDSSESEHSKTLPKEDSNLLLETEEPRSKNKLSNPVSQIEKEPEESIQIRKLYQENLSNDNPSCVISIKSPLQKEKNSVISSKSSHSERSNTASSKHSDNESSDEEEDEDDNDVTSSVSNDSDNESDNDNQKEKVEEKPQKVDKQIDQSVKEEEEKTEPKSDNQKLETNTDDIIDILDFIEKKEEEEGEESMMKVYTERHTKIFNESTEIEEHYNVGKKLGDGNFAVVHKVTDKNNERTFAMKIIDAAKMEGKLVMLNNEIKIQRNCSHPNIVQLYHDMHSPTKIYLIMELITGGDFFDLIANNVSFEEEEASMYMRDLCSGLDYLHQREIVHRDIKPENLMVYENNGQIALKIADFGLAMKVTSPIYTICGTPTYVGPEILTEEGYGLEVDVWAAGIILYIMLCGFPPFRSPNRKQTELFDMIEKGHFEFLEPYWDDVSSGAKDLISKILVVDKKERLKASQVFNHEWLMQFGLYRNNTLLDITPRKINRFKTAAQSVQSIQRMKILLGAKLEREQFISCKQDHGE